ncbi:ArnT family glycosyltransferase [Bellilinea sp.]
MRNLLNFLSDSKNTLKLLIGITFVSVLFRVGAALFLGNQISEMPGVSDQISYHTLGIRLAGGYGFTFDRPWWPATQAGEPTAHWSYLYSYFVAGIYWLFGPHPLLVRLLQALIIGIIHPLLIFVVGKLSFNSRVGLIAAAITSVYIYFVYYSATLMTEPFYIAGILAILGTSGWIVKNANQILENPRKYLLFAFLLGVATSLTILLRQAFLLFLPFLYTWLLFVLRKNYLVPALKMIGINVLIITLFILPFTIYNYERFNQFVLLNTNAGFAFYWANHPIYGTHFEGILSQSTYLDLLPKELYGLNEAALDRELLNRGLQFVIQDPLRYFFLSLSRIPVYFMFWPSPHSSILSNISRIGSFGVFLPFMIYGLMTTLAKKGEEKVTLYSPVFLLLLFILVYSLIHIFTWTLIRYRLPVDAVLVLFAAVGFSDLIQKIQQRKAVTLS